MQIKYKEGNRSELSLILQALRIQQPKDLNCMAMNGCYTRNMHQDLCQILCSSNNNVV